MVVVVVVVVVSKVVGECNLCWCGGRLDGRSGCLVLVAWIWATHKRRENERWVVNTTTNDMCREGLHLFSSAGETSTEHVELLSGSRDP